MQINDLFHVRVKKGMHSKTLGGREAAGRILGPFRATKILPTEIIAALGRDPEGRQFNYNRFEILKG